MEINNTNFNVSLVEKAKNLTANGKIDQKGLEELKKAALSDDGEITTEEAAFIGNLDDEAVTSKLQDSSFSPTNFKFNIDEFDNKLKMKDGKETQVDSGSQIFSNGKLDTKALKYLSQRSLGDENSQQARCSCNSTAVSLAMKSEDSFKKGIEFVKQEIKNGNLPNKEELLKRLDNISSGVDSKTLLSKDVNDFADILYQAYATDKTKTIMPYDDVTKMQKAVGLIDSSTNKEDILGAKVGTISATPGPGGKPKFTSKDNSGKLLNTESTDFKKSQTEVAKKVTDSLKNGETSTVGVFNGDKGTNQPNHFITVGKKDDGTLFVYDSDPNTKKNDLYSYIEGPKAEEYLAKKVGISIGAEKKVNKRQIDMDMNSAVTVIKHKSETKPETKTETEAAK